MSTPTIKAHLKEKIRKDETLKVELAKANNIKIITIDRWLKSDDEMLTTVRNLAILKRYFGVLETQELLESSQVEAAV